MNSYGSLSRFTRIVCASVLVSGSGTLRAQDGAAHAMGSCALDSLGTLFTQQFCVTGGAGCAAFASRTFDVPMTDFNNMVSTVAVPAGHMRGVWMQYGLDANNNFVAGFRVLDLVPESDGSYSYDTTGTMFYVLNAADKLVPGSYSTWAAGPLASYLSRVKVKRSVGASASDLDPAGRGDAAAYVLPWEEVLAVMENDNAADLTPNTRMVLSCVARQMQQPGGTNDFRHCLALYLRNASPLVDGVDHGTAFGMKSADYGSPCPVMCIKFTFYNHPPTGCK